MRFLSKTLVTLLLIVGSTAASAESVCPVEWVVLGVAQDAGIPQIGNPGDSAWQDLRQIQLPTAAALVDHRNGARYLFEATPAVTQQLQQLDRLAPGNGDPLGLSGVFLTHAHIGHYAGLMYFGHEAAGTQGLRVFAMPRMAKFLAGNGPWSQLLTLGNIALAPLGHRQPATLADGLSVTPIAVPHRDEYSETVAFRINGPSRSLLFVPDIDHWEAVQNRDTLNINKTLKQVDYAFVDATFYSDNELPGRDMSQIPHPRVKATMDRFDKVLTPAQRGRIYFIHFNHSNPIRDRHSAETREVLSRGYQVARSGQRLCLGTEPG